MPKLTIQLPPQEERWQFNLHRWDELSADPELTRFEGRIETDRYGHVIMSPPPAANHGSLQSEIAFLLRSFLETGRVITECPISTADGVKAADIAWASPERMAGLGNKSCFPKAPEICVEVLSPGNSDAEIAEKISLYLDAGAREVWTCGPLGEMHFLGQASSLLNRSVLCPRFPQRVELK